MKLNHFLLQLLGLIRTLFIKLLLIGEMLVEYLGNPIVFLMGLGEPLGKIAVPVVNGLVHLALDGEQQGVPPLVVLLLEPPEDIVLVPAVFDRHFDVVFAS